MADSAPQILGLRKSFGFGDPLGHAYAVPGHLKASRKHDFVPVLSGQSVEAMKRAGRNPREVIDGVVQAIRACEYSGSWGADTGLLKTEQEVNETTEAGFSLFTIDPSEHIVDRADDIPERKIMGEAEELYAEGVFQTLDWDDRFLGEKFVAGENTYRFDRECLYRAAIKYGRSLAYCEKLAGAIASRNGHGNYEIAVSFDATAAPTSPLEHLFLALELKHRGVSMVSLALRMDGGFEPGVDYRGDVDEFEDSLVRHVAIARRYGPYKLSVHNGSDKFSLYPILGRVCGDLLHVKTCGTTYLEALRIAFRADSGLFHEILRFSGEHFAEAGASRAVSTTADEAQSAIAGAASASEETLFADKATRQVLHAARDSVLADGSDSGGRPFREALTEILESRQDEYRETLEAHFDKHLAALAAG